MLQRRWLSLLAILILLSTTLILAAPAHPAAPGPDGETVTIRSDNGTNGDVQYYPLGSRAGVVLSPPAEYFPLKLSAVQFQVPDGVLRAQVSIHALEGGRPGALLAQSPALSFGTEYGWLTLDLSAANLVLDTPQPFLVTVEGTLGGWYSGETGFFLYHDTTANLPAGTAFYWQEGQWIDHAAQWAAPAQVGCPMIRAKVELAPAATATPTATTSGMITLQQGRDGYLGMEDAEISTWDPDASGFTAWGYGVMLVGVEDQVASLLRFDLSQVPFGAVVDQATLSLYAPSQYDPPEILVGAYEIARPWRQWTASWNCADRVGLPSTCLPWAVPGCNGVPADRAGTPEDEVMMQASLRWYDLDITAMVQRWVNDASANHGLALKAFTESNTLSNAFSLADSNAQPALRPKLTIHYHGGASSRPRPRPRPPPRQWWSSRSCSRTSPAMQAAAMWVSALGTPTTTWRAG